MQERFEFPIEPYQLQAKAVAELFADVQHGRLGVLQSPTGTGKSMMLTTAALAWLDSQVPPAAVASAPAIPLTKVSSRSSSSSSSQSDTAKVPLAKPKVFLSSRTHGQLAQLNEELQRSPYMKRRTDFRFAHIASRRQLCINQKILAAAGSSTEKHRDLCGAAIDAYRRQRHKRSGDIEDLDPNQSCSFCDRRRVQRLTKHLQCNSRDLAKTKELGEQLQACPFLASTNLVRSSHIVLVPYPYLVEDDACDALLSAEATNEDRSPTAGPSFTGDLMIFDEAHNLVDTVRFSASAEVRGSDFFSASTTLSAYATKYDARLLAKHKQKLREWVSFTDRCTAFMKRWEAAADHEAKREEGGDVLKCVYTLSEFLFEEAKVDNINLYDLLSFVRDANLERKLHAVATDEVVASFQRLVRWSQVLARAASDDARVFVKRDEQFGILAKVCSMDFRHLSQRFAEARAVIFAGGTMEPLELTVYPLLTNELRARCVLHTTGHVVPSTSLLLCTVPSGPSRRPFELTHAQRGTLPEQMLEICMTVLNFCRVIPRGVIVCFASYTVEEIFAATLDSSGVRESIVSNGRAIVRESRSRPADATIAEYRAALDNHKGAILTCVMGGKLSEGINFADDLARGVLVVGMPFPNNQDEELRHTLRYFATNSCDPVRSNIEDTVSDLYTALCMRSVNQAIGRCVRHRHDYAFVALLDKRYAKGAIAKRLPSWMQHSLVHCNEFGEAFRQCRAFFSAMPPQ